MRLIKLNKNEWLLIDPSCGLYFPGTRTECLTVLIDELEAPVKEVNLGLEWLKARPDHDTLNFGINLMVTHTSSSKAVAA